jgi:hypothetical protein
MMSNENDSIEFSQADNFGQVRSRKRPGAGLRPAFLGLVVAIAGACGDGTSSSEPPPPPLVEELDANGLSAPALSLESTDVLQFVNHDERPHQIYSNDCGDLSTTPLEPGQTISVDLAPGNRLCHFQDLLAPLDTRYWGTATVTEPPPPPPEPEPAG